ncbi:MAG: hypothetical protein GPJ54_03570 [Candidatus Heimdallarchaeota archaeon]|nr:hypothetical protein [Candidatus Heimdallarchaeota archaeon]
MNLTIEVVIIFLSVIPLFISSYLLFQQYRKFPDFVLGAMSLAWFSYGVYNFMSAISYLFLSENIFLLRSLLLPVFLILVEISVSFINNNRLHPLRFPLVSVFAASVTYTIFLPEVVMSNTFPNGDDTLIMVGQLHTATIVGLAYVLIIYFLLTIKIFYYASEDLKFWAGINLLGTLILGPIAYLTFLIKLNQVIPGITEFVFGLGTLVSAIAFYKRPQLFYVLPFKAIKLLVIKEGAGLTIYSYQWDGEKSEVKDPLFSSAIESINSFARIAIQHGNITQVKLEDAILIIQIPKDQNLYYALLATKSSHNLRYGLKKFSSMFYLTYHSVLESEFLFETSATNGADKLIDFCFPYIPKH